MQLGWLRRLLGVCHSAMQALLRRQDGSVGRDLHLERLRWLLTMLCAAAALATTDVINAAVRTAAALSGTARRFTAADITNAMPTLLRRQDKTVGGAVHLGWLRRLLRLLRGIAALRCIAIIGRPQLGLDPGGRPRLRRLRLLRRDDDPNAKHRHARRGRHPILASVCGQPRLWAQQSGTPP